MDYDYDSDHLPVEAQLKIHWRFGPKPRPPPAIRHNRHCTPEQRTEYNRLLTEAPLTWDNIQKHISNSAITARGTKPPHIKKHYITQNTLNTLEARDLALKHQDYELARQLTSRFRRQVRQDKKADITEQLRTFIGAQQNWPAIKKLRNKFTPRFSKRGHTRAAIPSNYPNDCADFFAKTHWAAITPQDTAMPPPLHNQAGDTDRFSLEELNEAIDNLKNNKTGGTDELITELFKDLDQENRNRLLTLYNQIWQDEEIPDHFNEALVIQIYKAGKIPEQYSSYRPIALLNVTYKILAKMLQERLRQELDDRIVPFQFGYRRGKSMAEPIFIARRAQEIAERHGTQLYMLALDYSKAFDSIPHDKLTECLVRMGASPKNIALVSAIYRTPRFRIKIPEGISRELTQDIGIRQGCPLSPYLYIIATSCLTEDFLRDLQLTDTPEGTSFPTLLFADDTLLLTKTARQMTKALNLIIEHSRTYNLYLNKEKCQLLVTNDLGCNVLFPEGTLVKKHDTIKYLGTTFSATLDVGLITRQKLAEAAQTLRLLMPLWKDTQISKAWKLTVFNAII